MSYHTHLNADEPFIRSGISREGVQAYRRHLPNNHDGAALIVLWRGDPGTYVTENAPYSETLIVFEGKGRVAIGGGAPVDFGPGSIAYLPHGGNMVLEVFEPTKTFCTIVVPGGLPKSA